LTREFVTEVADAYLEGDARTTLYQLKRKAQELLLSDSLTPRVLTVRKDSLGILLVSATNGGKTVHFAIGDPEVQYELLEVVRDEGPKEFILSY